jgi:uncharacterized protein
MTIPSYRAWRFVHPDFDGHALAGGLQLAPTGRVDMVEGAAAVRQSLLLLLSTRPGERVMRPTYGCNLHRLVFEPNDATTAGMAIHYVRQAVQRWEPRVEILHLDAGPHPEDPSRLDIVLEYRVRVVRITDRILFPVNLTQTEE